MHCALVQLYYSVVDQQSKSDGVLHVNVLCTCARLLTHMTYSSKVVVNQ